MFQVHGLVPAERNLGLMFTSFNRSDTDSLGFEDFVQAMQPFLAAQKQVDFAWVFLYQKLNYFAS